MDRHQLIHELLGQTGDVTRFRDEPVPRQTLEAITQVATTTTGAIPDPPWRVVVVIGQERERLLALIGEALSRHWGLRAVRPHGVSSEEILRAPALLLVFSQVPASEGIDAIAQVAAVAQNLVLACAAHGLATRRITRSSLVPEAVLEYVASHVGPQVRGSELVAMLAVGYPDGSRPEPRPGPAAEWIGLPGAAPPQPADPDLPLFATPAAVLRSTGGERVFVVDPYVYNRKRIQRLLRSAGYEVEVFEEGEALLARARAGEPAALYIVSDNLPDTSGFELVRALRPSKPPAPPLIVTTARRDSAFRIGGLAAGVDYYLRKPINPIELYTACRILLDRYRQGQELAQANEELSHLLSELRAAQARLVQQAKMASLGQLVAGIAHEINTPLGAVVSNNDLFLRCFERLRARVQEMGLDRDPVVARDLRAVEDLGAVSQTACRRITGIVRELRTFARLDEADRKSIDLHEALESTLLLVNHLIKGRIHVRREYSELPDIECHPNQLNQVFMNVIVNALQAMGEEGTLTLRTEAGPDGTARVHIQDTGPGIPRENVGRIFDPGFTTKGAGVGTGLGLSICYNIVAAHDGEITVESEPGQGTTFTVTLPAPRQGRERQGAVGVTPTR